MGDAFGSFWRLFPWNAAAKPGERFSPQYVSTAQAGGRFDLDCRPPVMYLAERPEHAIAEKLQHYRGRRLRAPHLREFGYPLALAEVKVSVRVVRRIADLADPAVLLRLGYRPDEIASHEKRKTQAIARDVHRRRLPGLKWWSSLTGEWHTTVLFLDRARVSDMDFGMPVPLTLESEALREAAAFLAIPLGPGRTG
jgi:hypothetical protein